MSFNIHAEMYEYSKMVDLWTKKFKDRFGIELDDLDIDHPYIVDDLISMYEQMEDDEFNDKFGKG